MKKRILVISIILFAIIFMCALINNSKAATTSLSASSTSVQSEGEFTINISSSIKLSGWTIDVSNNGGCKFISVNSSGAALQESKGSTGIAGINTSGATSLATYKFKAPAVTKDTTYTITFSGTAMCDATDAMEIVNNTTCKANVTVKAKQQPPATTNTTPGNTNSTGGNTNSQKPSTNTSTNSQTNSSTGTNTQTNSGTTKPKEPKFTDTSKTMYTTGLVNLRKSWSTSSNGILVEKGTEVTLTGTSTESVNGYVWYRVKYNGETRYVAKNLIQTTKPEEKPEEPEEKPEEEKSNNKNLTTLKIEGITIEPEFNPEVTQYTAHVDGDVTELKIDAKSEDAKAKVEIEGNKDLKEGSNMVKIKVTAEDETTRTYFIDVSKGEGTVVDESLKLAQLSIDKVKFGEDFNPEVHTYELKLNAYVDKLEVTAIANKTDAKVEIVGNENFVEGENKITILLTSSDGKETATYQIKVTVPAETSVAPTQTKLQFYIICGSIAVVAVIIIAIIVIVYKKRANKNEWEDNNEETNADEEELELPSFLKDRSNPDATEANTEPVVIEEDVTEEDNENQDDDKPRKSKGKHSI